MRPVGVVAITEKPKRTVPLGIVVTCLVVAVIYGLMSSVAAGYPFVSYLLVYIVALVPILTGMNVDSAISMLMIPTMLILRFSLECII